MARKPRFSLPGVPQHVVQRGNNREPCFFAPVDYRFYLDALHEAATLSSCTVHAYVLMTNHVHLLLTPDEEDSISRCLQSVGRRYVRYVNMLYHRSGTLWEGRYRASLVDSESYLLSCSRYIELNPVRAGMVPAPGDYPWSSYGFNAYGVRNELLAPHPEYLRLGSTSRDRQQAYRELIRDQLGQSSLSAIREALNQERVLGTDAFKDQIEVVLNRRIRPGRVGRPRKDEVREEAGSYVVY